MEGHLFTVHAQGLRDFAAPSSKDDRDRLPNPRRTTLSFNFDAQSPDSVKFVGMLHSSQALGRRAPNGVLQPKMHALSPDGAIRPIFVCSSPEGTPSQDRFLLLSCEALPRLDQGRDSSLLFLGGFDSPAIVLDPSKTTTMLAFSYLIPNGDELGQRIGSIDWRET